MTTRKTSTAIAATLIAVALMLIPAPAAGQTRSIEPIHSALRDAGIHVDNLRVIPIEGIVIVRGKVHDQQSFHRTALILKDLGYLRVANLLKITPPPNDEQIERAAERELAVTRALDGAHLTVSSLNGVVTINGKVRYELQRDAAINIVRGVEGVKDVQATIDLM